MGFFGNSMLVRADVELAELATVQGLQGTQDGEWTGRGGWRHVRFHNGRPMRADEVSAVAEQAGAPFLAAFVVDSDMAEVRFAAPGQAARRFVLHEKQAREYGCPVDPQEQRDAVPELIRWAGDGADAELMQAAVHGNLLFAEDSVLRLAAAIGAIPPGELEDYVFGTLEERITG